MFPQLGPYPPASSEPVNMNTNDASPMETGKSTDAPAPLDNDSSKHSSDTPNSTPPLSQDADAIISGQTSTVPEASNSIGDPSQPMETKGDEPNPVENDSYKDSMTPRSESNAPSQDVSASSLPASAANEASATTTSVPTTNGANKKPRLDYSSLPTRQYLDQTVVPILLQGLASLAKTRPEDPTKYLANFLLEHKQEFEDR